MYLLCHFILCFLGFYSFFKMCGLGFAQKWVYHKNQRLQSSTQIQTSSLASWGCHSAMSSLRGWSFTCNSNLGPPYGLRPLENSRYVLEKSINLWSAHQMVSRILFSRILNCLLNICYFFSWTFVAFFD